ncbi:ABC transporter substrate-binding protein [Domibacillus indicus]|uniref:ABC transporter substrate-binding protein n=1 Tax=Domibacillus indicus TaxID=1437523 RepID=UPI000617D027|nr:ABC transporter substrate-binding protein [Domibacillus indicus]
MKKNTHREFTVVLWAVIAGFLLLTGCTGESEEGSAHTAADKKAVLAFPWSPASLDPHGSDSWEMMRSGTAETLVKLNEELTPVPWLAKEWKQENENTWIFQLEEGVTFHNGNAMDAASVKKSLLRSLKQGQTAKDLLQIESIEVLSENELKIVTAKPNAALIAHLADPSTIIADVASLEGEAGYPAFTGAFQIKQFTRDESLVAERYKDYWGTPALLSEITIKFIPEGTTRLMALQSGDVDAATDIPIDNIAVLEKDERFRVLTAPSLRTHMMLFNLNSPLVNNQNLRKAIDLSIPRAEIVDSIMAGYGTEAGGPFPEVLPFGKVEKKNQAESVGKWMEEEGWQLNADGIWEKQGRLFEVTMLTFPQRPELTVMAEIIQNELLEKGIKAEIRQVENIDEALANDEWDLSMYSMLTAHTGDPQYFLNIFYQSDSASNVSHYASSSLDRLIDQLNQTVDSAKRNQLALQIQEVINTDLPQSFIVYPETVFAARKAVKGFTPHPIEYYYIHSQIDVNE